MVAILGFAAALSFEFNSKAAAGNFRKVSDYKSFEELCEDRNNQPQQTKDSIVAILVGLSDSNQFNCYKVGEELARIKRLHNTFEDYVLSDLNLLRFSPSLEYLVLDDEKIVSDFSSLESLKNLDTLILIVSSLDKLRNVRLNNLVQLELTVKGVRLASDPDIFKLMPKFSGSSPLTLYSRYRIGRDQGDQIIFANAPPTSSYLHLKGSNLTDISALGSAKGLIKLEIEGSKIQDIRALGVLTNLKSLRIYSPKLSNIEPLKSLTNLKTFGMSYSKVSDISVLRSLVNLEVLTLNQNLISDITPLTSLTKLEYLGLSQNLISDIPSLSSLTNLRTLDLYCNSIENVESLSSIVKIETSRSAFVNLGQNNISNIDFLLPISKYWSIDISGNKVNKSNVPSGIINRISTSNLLERVRCKTFRMKKD